VTVALLAHNYLSSMLLCVRNGVALESSESGLYLTICLTSTIVLLIDNQIR
jgi:hypothetical protein